MNLVVKVGAAFSPNDVPSQTLDDFIARIGQKEMALAVAQAIKNDCQLVVQASTGIDKIFFDLVSILLSGESTLLFTAIRALQDQLFVRDLPRLIDALKLPVQTVLLKGRGSCLCLHRMNTARQNTLLTESLFVRELTKEERQPCTTQTEDLAELSGLDEYSPTISLFTSTCASGSGSHCPQFRQCHINLARRAARAAYVAVINNHLFFADLAIPESGMAELLPSMRVAIFDEAHQLNETGVQFLGCNLKTGQLFDFFKICWWPGCEWSAGW